MFDHKCIKCRAAYKDEDPDPYYCEPCREVNKTIAANIAKKYEGINSFEREKSILQAYESLPKKRGFVSAADLHKLGFL